MMTGFELRISGVVSDYFTNYATNTKMPKAGLELITYNVQLLDLCLTSS